MRSADRQTRWQGRARAYAVVSHIDVAGGIQGDAVGAGQIGGAAADDGGWDSIAVAPRRVDEHAGGEVVSYIDVAGGIQRDLLWMSQSCGHGRADGGTGGLVQRSGAISHGRIDRNARAGFIHHIDLVVGIQRHADWTVEIGFVALDRGDGENIAAAPFRIDRHAGAAVRDVNVEAGIQRDAQWLVQARFAAADGGGGRDVTGAAQPKRRTR